MPVVASLGRISRILNSLATTTLQSVIELDLNPLKMELILGTVFGGGL